MKINSGSQKNVSSQTTQTTTKLPPMAATIRAIMPKLQYPPFRKETKDSKGKRNQDGCSGDNLAYAAIIQAMLHHAKGIRPDATEITVAPAVQQVAVVCQVNKRTIQRYLAELKEYGTITVRNKGSQISSDFTIHVGHLRMTPCVTSESPSRGDTVPPSDMTQSEPGVTQSEVRHDTRCRPQGYTSSGVNPQDKDSQEKATPTSSSPTPDSKSGMKPIHGDKSGSNVQPFPAKSSGKSGPFGKLKPITPEMEADPTVIAWRAAKKNWQEWDQKLRSFGHVEHTKEEYVEAKHAVNDWDDEWSRLDRIVHAMREESR